jgi:acetyl-CoA C-acetyltransferase
MHAVATAAARLRRDPNQMALITGLGWFATKHSAGVYSAQRPPQERWQRTDPKDDQARLEAMESPPTVERAEGPACVESYTVLFNREGKPEQGIVIGRLDGGEKPGARFIANTPPDGDLLWSMTQGEFVGVSGRVSPEAESGRNIFRP